ncbi:hypothetical protein ACSX1A_06085 [Pontibacter sp. MBLB2868]
MLFKQFEQQKQAQQIITVTMQASACMQNRKIQICPWLLYQQQSYV